MYLIENKLILFRLIYSFQIHYTAQLASCNVSLFINSFWREIWVYFKIEKNTYE